VKLPGWRKRTRHREEWRPVLEAELKRWSAKSWEQVLAEVPDVEGYQIEFQGKHYNVEVQILENTDDYIHVMVAVDDGSLPTALRALCGSFILRKQQQDSGV
jgi:hypothetical protein